jgi:hypothetical protein
VRVTRTSSSLATPTLLSSMHARTSRVIAPGGT